MSSENKIQSSVNERSWEHAIKSGRISRGNRQVNLDFLEETGLMNANVEILELGCTSGNLASSLHEKAVSVIGSDIAQKAIDHARKEHHDIEFQTHSADELPYDDQRFEPIISFDVLKHLPNMDQHLSEVWRVLKLDGYYLFQTLKCRSIEWKRYHPSLHFYGQLRRRLSRNGFSFRCVKMNTKNEFTINKIKKTGLPSWLFSWMNFRYLPFRPQTNYYVVAQKNRIQ